MKVVQQYVQSFLHIAYSDMAAAMPCSRCRQYMNGELGKNEYRSQYNWP